MPLLALLLSLFNILVGSLPMGIIFAIMALGVFISFRTLNIPDLTVDGSYTLGAAVSAVFTVTGQPYVGLALAFFAGCIAGTITALLTTKLKIQPLLSGILMMLALYSINLKVMGNKANIALLYKKTMFSILGDNAASLTILYVAAILAVIIALLFFFLKTKFGFVLRATGDNEKMVRALGVNTDATIILGLAISNGLVAFTGAIMAQYQSFTDVSMGIGMVIIGLASVIVGEVLFGTRTLLQRLIAVCLGSVLYRFVIALALHLGMPPTDLKLVSAVIVAAALSMTVVKKKVVSYRTRAISVGRYKGGQA